MFAVCELDFPTESIFFSPKTMKNHLTKKQKKKKKKKPNMIHMNRQEKKFAPKK